MQEGERIDPIIYDKLLQSEEQLSNYLKYIRYKQPIPKIELLSPLKTLPLNYLRPSHLSVNNMTQTITVQKGQKQCKQIKPYLRKYFALLKQVGCLQNSMCKKIIKKTIQFISQFPTMCFLIEVMSSFGKEKKKLCMNETEVQNKVNDDMIPLLQKIIQKIQTFKRESESKKLMQLGHRIQHLQILINNTKNKVKKNDQNQKIFRTFQSDRIQKYLLMEDNISKAEKNYGDFSPNFIKNREIFSDINKVYVQIKNSTGAKSEF